MPQAAGDSSGSLKQGFTWSAVLQLAQTITTVCAFVALLTIGRSIGAKEEVLASHTQDIQDLRDVARNMLQVQSLQAVDVAVLREQVVQVRDRLNDRNPTGQR